MPGVAAGQLACRPRRSSSPIRARAPTPGRWWRAPTGLSFRCGGSTAARTDWPAVRTRHSGRPPCRWSRSWTTTAWRTRAGSRRWSERSLPTPGWRWSAAVSCRGRRPATGSSPWPRARADAARVHGPRGSPGTSAAATTSRSAANGSTASGAATSGSGPGHAGPGRAGHRPVLQGAQAGGRALYDPGAMVHHEPVTRSDRLARRRPYGYGMGAACAMRLREGDLYALRLLAGWLGCARVCSHPVCWAAAGPRWARRGGCSAGPPRASYTACGSRARAMVCESAVEGVPDDLGLHRLSQRGGQAGPVPRVRALGERGGAAGPGKRGRIGRAGSAGRRARGHHPPVPIVETVRNVVADAATGEWILVAGPRRARLGRAGRRAAAGGGAPGRRRDRRAADEHRLRLPAHLPAAALRASAAHVPPRQSPVAQLPELAARRRRRQGPAHCRPATS